MKNKLTMVRDFVLGSVIGTQIGLIVSEGSSFVVWAVLFALVCELCYRFAVLRDGKFSQRQREPVKSKISMVLLMGATLAFIGSYWGSLAEYATLLIVAQWVLVLALVAVVLLYWGSFTSKMPCVFPLGATSIAGGTIGALIGTHLAANGFHLTGTVSQNMQLCVLVGSFAGTFLGRAIGELLDSLPIPHSRRTESV
jgi:hypothetical protein